MKLFLLLLIFPSVVFAGECINAGNYTIPLLKDGETNPTLDLPFLAKVSPFLYCSWNEAKSWVARSNVDIKEVQYGEYLCNEMETISQGNKYAQHDFISNIDFSAIPLYLLHLKSFEVYCPGVQQMSDVRECQEMAKNWSKHPDLTCSEYLNGISTESYRGVALDHVDFVDYNKDGYMDAVLDLTVDLYGSQADGDIKVVLTRKGNEASFERIGLEN